MVGVLAVWAALGTAPLRAQDAPAAGAPIVVELSGMHSDRGRMRCFLFASSEGYPTRPARARARVIVGITAARTARCTFGDVPPGDYAIAVHHDEDDDGEMDTGIFGIPTEGTGASNDARGSFGPPSFASARFRHGSERDVQVIHVSYVF